MSKGKHVRGGSGMGMSKHRKSGTAPQSPKLRMRLKLDAERAASPTKPQAEYSDKIQDLWK